MLQEQQDGAVGAKPAGWLPRHHEQSKWWVDIMEMRLRMCDNRREGRLITDALYHEDGGSSFFRNVTP